MNEKCILEPVAQKDQSLMDKSIELLQLINNTYDLVYEIDNQSRQIAPNHECIQPTTSPPSYPPADAPLKDIIDVSLSMLVNANSRLVEISRHLYRTLERTK